MPKANILVVDDTPENLHLLSTALIARGYNVRCVVNGQMALRVAHLAPPDLILLDIKMPRMDGYEVCERLKGDPSTVDIPVIFLSALDDVEEKVKAFTVGGMDYICKPFQFEEVVTRIEHQLDLLRAKAEIRTLNRELERRVRDRTAELEREIVRRQEAQAKLESTNRVLKIEILKRKRTQKKLLHMAWHDTLTDLPNRALFMKKLTQVLNRAQKCPERQFAVLFLDCDRFKVVNDSLGHLVGDALLVAVAERLRSCIPLSHTIARLGGDEFTILLESIQSQDEMVTIADLILNQLGAPFYLLDQYEVFINASIGIVLGGANYQKPEHILRDADTAMYRAKDLGKARHQIFDTTMHAQAQKRLALEMDLRRAIENREFILNYQPIVSLRSGKVAGFEALIRWIHPDFGLIYPGDFIPVAEETGLIIPLGLWVWEEACRQLRVWKEKYRNNWDYTLSVNLSVKQFSQPDLLDCLQEALLRQGLDGTNLRLEITESAVMENADHAIDILNQLKALKVKLSIDDFGTGYSSLSYLQNLPVDTLKIDSSFVNKIGEKSDNFKIVAAIVTLAHNLGMGAIAEGIKTPQQLAHLRSLGCEFGQGFFFSKSLDAESLEALIARSPRW
ncbi:MAG: two-component system response regulator [Limnospira sp.]